MIPRRGRVGATRRFDERLRIEQDRIGPWRAAIDSESRGFGGGAHGGHLAALALRGLEERLEGRAPPARSLALRFLEPTRPGWVEILAEVDRLGSSDVAASVRMSQSGALTCTGHGHFGVDRVSPAYLGTKMPSVPPPEDCRPLLEKPAPEASAGLLVEHRPARPPLPLSGGSRAEILVWMRLVEERPLDVTAATMLADAGPPALFGWLSRFVPMPSVEISVQYCDLPGLAEGPWLLGAFRTISAGAGYAIEDGEMWTRSGRLALVSRQTRRILVDRSPRCGPTPAADDRRRGDLQNAGSDGDGGGRDLYAQ